jgi:hypothetical protein
VSRKRVFRRHPSQRPLKLFNPLEFVENYWHHIELALYRIWMFILIVRHLMKH